MGAVVGKLDIHRTTHMMRGYVAMLAVSKECRKRRIGTSLVERVILEMAQRECEEVPHTHTHTLSLSLSLSLSPKNHVLTH